MRRMLGRRMLELGICDFGDGIWWWNFWPSNFGVDDTQML